VLRRDRLGAVEAKLVAKSGERLDVEAVAGEGSVGFGVRERR